MTPEEMKELRFGDLLWKLPDRGAAYMVHIPCSDRKAVAVNTMCITDPADWLSTTGETILSMESLTVGSRVKNKISMETYVVCNHFGTYAFAVSAEEVTDPQAWMIASKIHRNEPVYQDFKSPLIT